MLADQAILSPQPSPYNEYEVGIFLGLEVNNREVTQELQVAEHTINAHVIELFCKLGVTDRVRPALLMMRCSISTSS